MITPSDIDLVNRETYFLFEWYAQAAFAPLTGGVNQKVKFRFRDRPVHALHYLDGKRISDIRHD